MRETEGFEEEIFQCTLQVMILLIELYRDGLLTLESFCRHTHNKIKYLEDCLTMDGFSSYSKEALNIFAHYKNILEKNSVLYRIPG